VSPPTGAPQNLSHGLPNGSRGAKRGEVLTIALSVYPVSDMPPAATIFRNCNVPNLDCRCRNATAHPSAVTHRENPECFASKELGGTVAMVAGMHYSKVEKGLLKKKR